MVRASSLGEGEFRGRRKFFNQRCGRVLCTRGVTSICLRVAILDIFCEYSQGDVEIYVFFSFSGKDEDVT